MPSVNSQKKIAAELLKCGVSRIRVKASKEVEEALTRNDIKILIKKGQIYKLRKKGSSKAYSKIKQAQRKKGRRKGIGKRKGTANARSPRKREYIKSVRTLRNILKGMRDNNQIKRSDYRTLYLKIKGGSFRNKTHFLYYLKEHEYIKAKPKKKRVVKPPKKKEIKAPEKNNKVAPKGVKNEKKK